MHFTKPAWVMHKDSSKSDQNAKRLSIFSIHVHPDGSRIATGGLDAKIRIWSTKPILNPAAELSNKPPKSLCTLTMHTGPVLVVRWAHSGRWLASGSDDEIVMIWDLDPHAKGRVWGSDEINVEGWKPMKRLPGHESDVVDVAWSPGDRYLASVGLDSKVMIWCGYTLERLRKLDDHQGFVKGVCWDPVGEFLATQSDDRTVKIWNTTDWSLRAEVTKPFAESPGSTFFRRLRHVPNPLALSWTFVNHLDSWSPDGAHITASNATNNKGFVFIAAVITRNTWSSEISLVGHENTVEVASYNPHIFLRNPEDGVHTNNICSVVALGADDRSVSIWQTKAPRPLIVAKEVFERQIMDLAWSSDGMTLYAASSDGTIAAFNFEPDELEGIAPVSAQEEYLMKFGFQMPEVPAGYSHTTMPESADSAHSQPTGFSPTNGSGERVNVLVAKRGKKRANLNSIPSASIPSASAPLPPRNALQYYPEDTSISARRPASSFNNNRFPSPSEQPFAAPETWSRHADMGMDLDVPIDAIDTGNKRKASNMMDLTEDGRPATKARTLGGDRKRDYVPVKTIEPQSARPNVTTNWQANPNAPILSVPAVLNSYTAEVGDSDDTLEGRNHENSEPTEIFYACSKQTRWLDYLPSPIILMKASSIFCAAATLDGTIHVWSSTGRRLMSPLALGVPSSFMEISKNALLVITSSGMLYCWNTKEKSAFFPPVSITSLLSSPNITITGTAVRPNGVPIITCSDEVVYSYDSCLSTWVKVTDKWWMDGSDAWSGRQRANASNTNRGIMSSLEASISSTPDESMMDKPRPDWWSAALTLGHLETRLHSTRLLDSPQEYKQALLLYAKRIADEGFRGMAEELIRELFGPVFCRPGREETWTPTIVGLSKRDLLKDVLSVFARSKTLTKLAIDWQDTLKKATIDD